jgi:4-hydroxy-2-oxoheptanedioate aldolase
LDGFVSLRERLDAGKVVLGTWSVVASPTVAEIAGAAGLDFLILDLEHGAHDYASLENGIRAVEGTGGAALVRVPDLGPSTFQRVLDLGAEGVIVPQVRGAEDAELAVRCSRYAPLGSRGYNPFTRAANYAAPARAGAGKLDPRFPLVGVIIENRDAFADIGRICAVDGVAFIYLGVYDMSLALDCNGDVAHPRVQDFVAAACDAARSAGKKIGMMVRSEREIEVALAHGATLLVWGVDANVIYRAFEEPVAALRNLAGQAGEAAAR